MKNLELSNNINTFLKIDRNNNEIEIGCSNSQLYINRDKSTLTLKSNTKFGSAIVVINADELNIYVKKIRFYIESLSNYTVFSTSLSGIKYSYKGNSAYEIIFLII
jgi:hypothetical protein